ncbi:MAG TPA: DUF2939 domain-containing protein [Lysobacter sp.]
MKKTITLLVLIAALLLGYVVAGPYLAVKAIREAVKTQDTAALSEHVDFPALRSSLKLQVDDYLVRRTGADVQSSLLGSIALRIASGATGGMVDAMATPAGLGAMLEGRNLWHRVTGGRNGSDSYATEPPRDPLKDAKYRFESPSRFTATVHDDDGDPVVFVLTRHGLRWKVSDVRLPL